MNEELPPFKNGKQNSESASTIDRVITPLINQSLIGVGFFSPKSINNFEFGIDTTHQSTG